MFLDILVFFFPDVVLKRGLTWCFFLKRGFHMMVLFNLSVILKFDRCSKPCLNGNFQRRFVYYMNGACSKWLTSPKRYSWNAEHDSSCGSFGPYDTNIPRLLHVSFTIFPCQYFDEMFFFTQLEYERLHVSWYSKETLWWSQFSPPNIIFVGLERSLATESQ